MHIVLGSVYILDLSRGKANVFILIVFSWNIAVKNTDDSASVIFMETLILVYPSCLVLVVGLYFLDFDKTQSCMETFTRYQNYLWFIFQLLVY